MLPMLPGAQQRGYLLLRHVDKSKVNERVIHKTLDTKEKNGVYRPRTRTPGRTSGTTTNRAW